MHNMSSTLVPAMALLCLRHVAAVFGGQLKLSERPLQPRLRTPASSIHFYVQPTMSWSGINLPENSKITISNKARETSVNARFSK